MTDHEEENEEEDDSDETESLTMSKVLYSCSLWHKTSLIVRILLIIVFNFNLICKELAEDLIMECSICYIVIQLLFNYSRKIISIW